MARAEATAAAGSESELGLADGKLMDPAALERLKKFYRDILTNCCLMQMTEYCSLVFGPQEVMPNVYREFHPY